MRVGNNFTTAGYAQGVGEISGVTDNDGSHANVMVNGATVSGISENFLEDTWSLIGFGWGKDQGYLKVSCSTGGACAGHNNNMTHTVSSWNTPGTYFIGDYLGNCQSGCEYIVHSIRVFSSELPGVAEDLYGAVYNEWYSQCGSGTREGGESCDDGNYNNGDGCSSLCAIETRWTCSGGDTSNPDTCSDDCGDGFVVAPISTYCDDGNTDSNDGCSSTCQPESGWTCTLGDSSTASSCTDTCGDDKVMDPTANYCDDGSKVDGDGCSSACAVEAGWSCTLGDSTTASVCSDDCGDGKVMVPASGYCDDGDKTGGDGCSASCGVESGWECTLGDSSTPSSCSEICGDGKVMDPTANYCDDGSKVDGDGCSSACAVETGWRCTLGDSSTASVCNDDCGDGKVVQTSSNYCDDGDKDDNDGCNSTCQIESGWECTTGDSSTASVCSDECGDGKVMDPQSGYCDDGNKSDGDGCSSTCAVEPDWTCSLGGTSSASSCYDTCGDGKVVQTGANYCDDGDKDNGDGCSSNCQIESGWECTTGDATTASQCTETCGDGTVINPTSGYCDDGNKNNGDGCDSSCAEESGWNCTLGDSTTQSSCTDSCGNGAVMNPTAGYCDDGGKSDGDGCSSACSIESGWVCTLGDSSTPSVCADDCGDGKVMLSSSTYCDDGDKNDGDGCSSSCNIETGWICTLGDQTTASVCSDKCGDGIVVDPKNGYCDDGNNVDDDGCNSTCQVEANANCTLGDSTSASICTDICGDGFISIENLASSYCDDGNTDDGDGCSSSCSVEDKYICEGGSSTSKSVCQTCSVENCSECLSDDINKCKVCNDGYEVNNGKCSKPSAALSSSATAASQAAVGGVAAAAAINSVLNMSSPTVMWAMANQLQLLLLLVLTKSSMPDEIVQFLTGNRFASFSFDFLHLESLPGIGIPKRWFLKDQEISSLTEIGIESGSTFYNNFALLLMLFFLLPIHLGVIFLPKCRKMPYSETRWKSILGKFYTKAREALYELFHFSIYIRLILEAYQFIMLACVAEIYQMRYREYASFSISCVALLLCIFFLCLSYFMYSSTKKFYDDEQHYHCKELVRGLKDNKEARIYTFFLLLRRFILVAWLIGMCESNKYFLIVFLSGFQLFYLGRILYSRPLQHVCDNLVEITNEIFFTVLALILVYLNTEDKWKGSNTSIYMYILISNNFVIVSIMFGNLMRNIFVKCKAKCSKNSKTAPKAPQPKPPIILARPSTTSKIYSKSDLSAVTKLSTNQLNQQPQNNIIIKKILRKTD